MLKTHHRKTRKICIHTPRWRKYICIKFVFFFLVLIPWISFFSRVHILFVFILVEYKFFWKQKKNGMSLLSHNEYSTKQSYTIINIVYILFLCISIQCYFTIFHIIYRVYGCVYVFLCPFAFKHYYFTPWWLHPISSLFHTPIQFVGDMAYRHHFCILLLFWMIMFFIYINIPIF